jgi:glyoxylase-like metal-dependent hydrolase (beta-lactamase superfamily II)
MKKLLRSRTGSPSGESFPPEVWLIRTDAPDRDGDSPRGCGAVVDTGYRTRVDEIRNRIWSALQQWLPRWLIDTHWYFDHTDGNSVSRNRV